MGIERWWGDVGNDGPRRRGGRGAAVVLACAGAIISGAPSVARAQAVRPGFDETPLWGPCSALNPYPCERQWIHLPFPITFFGETYWSVTADVHGLVILDDLGASHLLPDFWDLIELDERAFHDWHWPTIVPFLHFLHAEGVPLVGYAQGDVYIDAHPWPHRAWGITWRQTTHPQWPGAENIFQLVIIERGELGPGSFDIELNFERIEWGLTYPLGIEYPFWDSEPITGFTAGTGAAGTFIEIPSGGQLPENSLNSGVRGRYVLPIRDGEHCPPSQPAPCDDLNPCGVLEDSLICAETATTTEQRTTLDDSELGTRCMLSLDLLHRGYVEKEIVTEEYICHDDCTTSCARNCEMVHAEWDWERCRRRCKNGRCQDWDRDSGGYWWEYCHDTCYTQCTQSWDSRTNVSRHSSECGFEIEATLEIREAPFLWVDGEDQFPLCSGPVFDSKLLTGVAGIAESFSIEVPGRYDICLDGELLRRVEVPLCGITVPPTDAGDGGEPPDAPPPPDAMDADVPDAPPPPDPPDATDADVPDAPPPPDPPDATDADVPDAPPPPDPPDATDGDVPDAPPPPDPPDATDADVPDGPEDVPDAPDSLDGSTPDDGGRRAPMCGVKIPQNIWTIAEGTPEAHLPFYVIANDWALGDYAITLVRYDADDHLPPFLPNPPFVSAPSSVEVLTPNIRTPFQLTALDPHPVDGMDVWMGLTIRATSPDHDGDGQPDAICEGMLTVRLRCQRDLDCNDGSLCTEEMCRPKNPAADRRGCVVTPKCTAGPENPCQSPTCEESTGTCSTIDKPFGAPCASDPANLCILRSACDHGACVATTSVRCPEPPPCYHEAICDPATGLCSEPVAMPDGSDCEDGDACTLGDSCQSGLCVAGGPIQCPVDQCHPSGACDPEDGCPEAAPGASCDDGNACTTGDTCVDGGCGGEPFACRPLDSCHLPGSCAPESGCSNPPAPTCCGDGTLDSSGGATWIELAWLATPVTPGAAPITFSINGTPIWSGEGSDGSFTCSPPIRTATISDPAVLASLTPGLNTFSVSLENPHLLAWAVARVHSSGERDVVIHDSAGGGDAEARTPNLCDAGSSTLQAGEQTVVVTLELVEECDDGNLTAGDGCDPSCRSEGCGNGRIDDGEECDDDNTDGGDGCSPFCQDEVCGDGAPGPGEECDDGNIMNADGCDADCRLELCGNARIDAQEACDDGNLVDDDDCRNTCALPECGDGVTQDGHNVVRAVTLRWLATGCGATPDLLFYVDGAVAAHAPATTADCACWPEPGELVITDPAILASFEGGHATLFFQTVDPILLGWVLVTVEGPTRQDVVLYDFGGGGDALAQNPDLCGAGYESVLMLPHQVTVITGMNEQCDDGNTADGDTCSSACGFTGCGDGALQSAEQCDDGNQLAGDGCSAACTVEVCGDGLPGAGEECDDGNDLDGDGCTPTCEAEVCGNGRVDAGEQCDDGNDQSDDLCNGGCSYSSCGDGVLQPSSGTVEAIELVWVATTCSAPADITFTVNGHNAFTGHGSDADCGCVAPIRSQLIDDPVLLAEVRDGQVPFTVELPEHAFLGWAVAVVYGRSIQEVVIYDFGGGGDAESRNSYLCGAGYEGQGVVRAMMADIAGMNEECDDGNGDGADGCSPSCKLEVCGDGWGDGGEQCDDGNTTPGDGCRADCTEEYCGDGILDAGEECDDGNEESGDGCAGWCVTEGLAISCEPAAVTLRQASTAAVTCEVLSLGDYAGAVTPSCADGVAGIGCVFYPETAELESGGALVFNATLIAEAGAATGASSVDIVVAGPEQAPSARTPIALVVPPCEPATIPVAIYPLDGETGVPGSATLTWTPSANATSYLLQVAADPSFVTPLRSYGGTTPSFAVGAPLLAGVTYYWRIAAQTVCGTRAASATNRFTVGAPATNRLVNPGFEEGATGWTLTGSGTITNDTSAQAAAGSWYGRIGGTNGTFGGISQVVAIPASAASAYLLFRYRVTTTETDRVCRDNLSVQVVNAATNASYGGQSMCNATIGASAWRGGALIDVSAARGQSVIVRFAGSNDAARETSFYIDEVVLAFDGP